MDNPEKIIDKVRIIISTFIPEFDFKAFNHVFYDIIRLFHGEFPEYQKCNTDYHDLKHTIDVLIAMTRLINSHIFMSRWRGVSNWENLEANIINIRTVKADFFENTFTKNI